MSRFIKNKEILTEVTCMPSDMIKIEKKAKFLGLTFNRFWAKNVAIDDSYWRKLAFELGHGIMDYMRYPPKIESEQIFENNAYPYLPENLQNHFYNIKSIVNNNSYKCCSVFPNVSHVFEMIFR